MADDKSKELMVYLPREAEGREVRDFIPASDTGDIIHSVKRSGKIVGKVVMHPNLPYHPSKHDRTEMLVHLVAEALAGYLPNERGAVFAAIMEWYEGRDEKIPKSEASKLAGRIIALAKAAE